jgi:hypothetical protein
MNLMRKVCGVAYAGAFEQSRALPEKGGEISRTG